MPRHLVLSLSSPLVAFGGEAIDNLGVIRDFPAASMMTGILASALGWDRAEHGRHAELQSRLRFGTLLLSAGERLRDFQTAQLGKQDSGWTTAGVPEGRAGGDASYNSPHLRYRDYHAEIRALVALRLEPVEAEPTLDEIAVALDRPKRPLFIGRKPCLPDGRLVNGWVDAADVLAALQRMKPSIPGDWRAQWPEGEGELPGDRCTDLCDERNWRSGVHGGWRPVREGMLRSDGRSA